MMKIVRMMAVFSPPKLSWRLSISPAGMIVRKDDPLLRLR